MAKRKQIGKKKRFEVFKRDKFTCQYCGKKAPDVVLHADHIKPVSKGGTNSMTNLVTSCAGCNMGKGKVELSDESAVSKKKKQLDELQDRREQLEMMVDWEIELLSIDEAAINGLEKIWESLQGTTWTGSGRADITKLLKKYGFQEVAEAIKASATQYESDVAFSKVSRICACRQRTKDKPWMKELFYIRGILRNRMYCNDRKALALLEAAHNAGAGICELREVAKTARNWTHWNEQMNEKFGAA